MRRPDLVGLYPFTTCRWSGRNVTEAERKADDEADGARHAERAVPEELERQDRLLRARLDERQRGEQDDGADGQREHLGRRQGSVVPPRLVKRTIADSAEPSTTPPGQSIAQRIVCCCAVNAVAITTRAAAPIGRLM
jgi:hypothetical protein